MTNNSFKIGDSNNNSGTNSTILGGNNNYIAFGATSVQLVGCYNTVVNGDVLNFVGVNLRNRVIDNSFNNSTITGRNKTKALRVTSSFSIDGLYDVYEIDLDATGVGITCTWDVDLFPIQVEFKVVANSSEYSFIIDDVNSPTTTIDSENLPYTTGLALNGSMIVYSNGTTLKTIAPAATAADGTSIQKINVYNDGTLISTRESIDFKDTYDNEIKVSDDSINDKIEIKVYDAKNLIGLIRSMLFEFSEQGFRFQSEGLLNELNQYTGDTNK